MQLAILGPQHIRLDTADGADDLAVQGGPFGPLQMLAASLALCTLSVVASYAETARLDIDGIAIEVVWSYADDPYRVGRYELTLHLPQSLPAARHRAVIRAAHTCTVHQTMLHAPAFETTIRTFDPAQAPPVEHHHHDHAHKA
jgi:putative redox protein